MYIVNNNIVEIYTDGGCRGNPGPGGWGAVLRFNKHEKHLYGAEQETTNNRMEILAAIMALASLKRSCHIILTTDSQYLRKGITEWCLTWQQNGWRTANKKSVKNADLWQQLILETQRHEIDWRWVKGHNGHPENEMADKLANKAIDELLNK